MAEVEEFMVLRDEMAQSAAPTGIDPVAVLSDLDAFQEKIESSNPYKMA